MSRKSIAEYIAEKRRAYGNAGKAKRSRILDEVCETLGLTRKYVIKLLTGNIRYRERKGRGGLVRVKSERGLSLRNIALSFPSAFYCINLLYQWGPTL